MNLFNEHARFRSVSQLIRSRKIPQFSSKNFARAPRLTRSEKFHRSLRDLFDPDFFFFFLLRATFEHAEEFTTNFPFLRFSLSLPLFSRNFSRYIHKRKEEISTSTRDTGVNDSTDDDLLFIQGRGQRTTRTTDEKYRKNVVLVIYRWKTIQSCCLIQR